MRVQEDLAVQKDSDEDEGKLFWRDLINSPWKNKFLEEYMGITLDEEGALACACTLEEGRCTRSNGDVSEYERKKKEVMDSAYEFLAELAECTL